ncbi:hypothetical protein [Idiomarina aminovorans]|uniref:hypothetical protein n=1 Tax=Idiomarina aminovorans TaxID=2914829 RepID=UPI0020068181|nr:hypothetical protein [Idiomarina sp. ATCH4]MCK7458802.1 hypothetical protein [Idiomarina sp. ATCH4]
MFVNNCWQSQNQKNEERQCCVGDIRLELLQQMRGFVAVCLGTFVFCICANVTVSALLRR